jgi:hypothetical protein
MFTINEWLDKIGDWNPQLLREIRGRLKFRSLLVAVMVALLVQVIMILFFTQVTPGGICTGPLRTCPFTPWDRWWINQFRILSWVIPLMLFVNVVYTLVGDLLQEEKLGTFNFIRLSPRSSGSVLVGKILGVPMLGYIATLLFMPYHIVTSIAVKVDLGFLLSYYSIVLLMTLLLASFSVLTAFLSSNSTFIGSNQMSSLPIVWTGLTLVFVWPVFILWNLQTVWREQSELFINSPASNLNIQWFTLPITSSSFLAHFFLFAQLITLLVVIWRLLGRRFYNPDTTVISKRQSYFLAAYLNVSAIGFFVHSARTGDSDQIISDWLFLGTTYVINWILLLGISLSVSPKRQHLLDWVRYGAWHHHRHGYDLGQLIQDLLWSEKSPATLAIVVNILISQIPLWLFWQVQGRGTYDRGDIFVTGPDVSINPSVTSLRFWIIQGSLWLTILLYSLVIQLGKFLKTRNPDAWTAGAVIGLIFLPGTVLRVLSLMPEKYPALWLFFGSPWAALIHIKNPNSVVIAFMAQLVVIGILGAFLYGKLTQGLKALNGK